MGRPTLCTPERTDAICRRIAAGNYLGVSARAEGIAAGTLSEWMARGAAGEEPYATFAESVTRARAQSEADMVAEVRASLDRMERPDPNSIKWLLERTRPERYGQKIEVVAKEAAARDILERLRQKLTQDAFERVLDALLEEGGWGDPVGGDDSRG